MELYDYQTDAIAYARQHLRENKRLLIQIPTGGGKTVIFAQIILSLIKAGKSFCVLANRLQLVDQAFAEVSRTTGVKIQMYDASTRGPMTKYCIASSSTLKARKLTPMHDVILVDEAHLADFDNILHKVKNRVIAFTATPWRQGKETTLADIYSHIYAGPQVSLLVEKNRLKPALIYSTPGADLSQLKKKNNEYTNESQDKAMLGKTSMESMYQNWLKYRGKASIFFTHSVKASQQLCEFMAEKGHKVLHLDGTIKKEERERIDNLLRTGQIDGISNCAVLTFGYDNPIIDTVVVYRKTTSLALWLQMCGRGSRLYPDKENFVVIDCGDNVMTHGHWAQDRDWVPHFFGAAQEVSENEGEPIKQIVLCGKCYFVYEKKIDKCPRCGNPTPVPKPTIKHEKLVEKDLELTEVKKVNLRPIKIETATVDEIIERQLEMGYKNGWAINIFKHHRHDPLEHLYAYAVARRYKLTYINRVLGDFKPYYYRSKEDKPWTRAKGCFSVADVENQVRVKMKALSTNVASVKIQILKGWLPSFHLTSFDLEAGEVIEATIKLA